MAWQYENLSQHIDMNNTWSTNNPAYFWTVDTYEVGGQTGVTVPITTDTKSVRKENEIHYVIRVWRQTNSLSPSGGGAMPINRDHGVEVYVRESYVTANQDKFDFKKGSDTKNDSHGQYYQRKTALTFPFYPDPIRTVGATGVTTDNETQKNLFICVVGAKKSNTFLLPKFFVKLKENSTYNNANDLREVLPYPGMKPPAGITFTTVKKDPSVPNIVREEAYQEELITLDKCSTPNRWAAVIKTPTTQIEEPKGPDGVKWSIKYYPLDADNMSPALLKQNTQSVYIGYDYRIGIPGKDGVDHGKIARLKLSEIRNNTCKDDDDDGSSDTPPFQDSKPVEFDIATRTNPPNHYTTRSVSHWNKIKANIIKDFGSARGSSAYNIPKGRLDILNTENSAAGVLGMVFQDAESAKALNLDTKKPWGFRFVYNPTSISYSTSMDTSIDWILATHDPANYIGGSFGVGLTLYLNRVADMTELAGLKNKWSSYGQNYPRTLREEEVQGILHRGTEYDLEFLYRVVNGDPKPSENTLLTYKENGQNPKTADFGYITGTPVWLKIHPNMRYKVSLASLSVNHVIFTEQMVPMFTTVDLQFIRYPIASELDSTVEKAFNEKQAKYRKGQEEAPKGEKPQ